MFGGGDDPFRDIESFFRKMSQLGGNGFISSSSGSSGGSSSFSRTVSNGGTFESIARGSFCPPTTITDNGNQFLLDLDVPGISREDLKVTATSQKLCISGQRRPIFGQQQQQQQRQGKNEGGDFFGLGGQQQQIQQQQSSSSSLQQQFQQLLMDERPVGFFERCFTFPNKIEENNISAQFNNGVLSVAVGHGGNDDGSKEISIR